MPVGHFGQIIYYYLKNKQIKGFIDNRLLSFNLKNKIFYTINVRNMVS